MSSTSMEVDTNVRGVDGIKVRRSNEKWVPVSTWTPTSPKCNCAISLGRKHRSIRVVRKGNFIMVLDIVEKLKSRITAVEVVVVGRPIRSGCSAFLHIQVQVTLGNLYKV